MLMHRVVAEDPTKSGSGCLKAKSLTHERAVGCTHMFHNPPNIRTGEKAAQSFQARPMAGRTT